MAQYSRAPGKKGSGSGFIYKLKMFLVIAATLLMIFSFFWGESGLVRLWYLSKKIERVERNIKVLKVQRNDILWETNKIKFDPDYIQRYAIETYGYARPEQKIIQFVPPDSSSKSRMKPIEDSKVRRP
jgi:cell division protein FtsB